MNAYYAKQDPPRMIFVPGPAPMWAKYVYIKHEGQWYSAYMYRQVEFYGGGYYFTDMEPLTKSCEVMADLKEKNPRWVMVDSASGKGRKLSLIVDRERYSGGGHAEVEVYARLFTSEKDATAWLAEHGELARTIALYAYGSGFSACMDLHNEAGSWI